MQITKREVPKFKKWLKAQGAEMLPPTNPYEVIRFKCKDGTGVLYKNNHGKYNAGSDVVINAFHAFQNSESWGGKPDRTNRVSNLGRKRKRQLIARDGKCCFYCGQPLGDDITIEHILSLVHGGSNRLENLALAHKKCNDKAHHLSVVEKIQLRDRLRIGQEELNNNEQGVKFLPC